MTKTTKNIKFSTYHVNICTDMGYMFMMTKKKQSVKQININKNVLNDYQIYWKRSQYIHGLQTIISIVLV
jgi:predicted fused transcriptional regulator/phosphomethylpyrimidine kinase